MKRPHVLIVGRAKQIGVFSRASLCSTTPYYIACRKTRKKEIHVWFGRAVSRKRRTPSRTGADFNPQNRCVGQAGLPQEVMHDISSANKLSVPGNSTFPVPTNCLSLGIRHFQCQQIVCPWEYTWEFWELPVSWEYTWELPAGNCDISSANKLSVPGNWSLVVPTNCLSLGITNCLSLGIACELLFGRLGEGCGAVDLLGSMASNFKQNI